MWLYDDELKLLRSQPHVPDQPALIPGAPTTFQDSILNSMVDWWFALAVWNTRNKGTVAFSKTDLESNNKPATRKWPWFHGVFSWANLRLCCPQWVHSSQPKACLSWSTKGRTDMGLMGAYRWTLGVWGFPGFPRNSQNDHQMNWGQPNQPMVQSWIPWWGCCNTTWPQKKEFCPALSSSVQLCPALSSSVQLCPGLNLNMYFSLKHSRALSSSSLWRSAWRFLTERSALFSSMNSTHGLRASRKLQVIWLSVTKKPGERDGLPDYFLVIISILTTTIVTLWMKNLQTNHLQRARSPHPPAPWPRFGRLRFPWPELLLEADASVSWRIAEWWGCGFFDLLARATPAAQNRS